MRLLGFIFILALASIGAAAQNATPDTMLYLDDVNIVGSRINRFSMGQQVFSFDSLSRSAFPSASLADLMNGFTSGYVRNYGQGTLSTFSIRGTSANHNALLWNGIRISPPNIGYLDFSLVQGIFFRDISILYGGAGPMFGSGAIGGSIHLQNLPMFGEKRLETELDISAGSFGTISADAAATFVHNKFYSRTAFNILNSDNDFPYTDNDGERVKLPHAGIFKSGFIQDVAFKLNETRYLLASAWFQYAGRDIPPTVTEDRSEANQIDRSWRTMILWKELKKKHSLEAKLAYFNEFTRYQDPLLSIYSVIKSQTLTGSFEGSWEAGKNSTIYAGTRYTYEYADLDNYYAPADQHNLAIYASFRYNFPKWDWQASINGRQEFLTDYTSPFLISAGMQGKIWKNLSGRISVSRNFRAPTFNERYWQPGGNPDVEPEKSWNEEAGLSFENIREISVLKFEITAFNSNVDDWILWLPGGSYWSVENAQKVWSRGLEFSGMQKLTVNKLILYFDESYTFSKSTNRKKLFELDASYNKQLIYTPLHRFVISPGAVYKGFNLSLKANFTGKVYITKDNTDSLPAYFLLGFVASRSFKIKKMYPITLQLNLNNILNQEYEVIPYCPMPGVNFLFTVRAGGVRQ